MRLAHLKGNGTIEIADAPEPMPKEGEVVIQTAVSALCGSELHAYRGSGAAKGNSGHEAAGTVAQLGSGVAQLRLGQRVGVSAIAGCGACRYCVRGQFTWCPHFRFYGNMHAERFVAAASACHPLPDDISWEESVLLSGDALGVPYHTSTKLQSPDIQTIAIFGAGPIGLGNALVQAHLGRRVIVVDFSLPRLDYARRLGAEAVIDASGGDLKARIRAIADEIGPDACIEAAGRPESVLACFEAVRTGGTVVFNGEQGALPLSPSDHFIRRDITAVGAWFYHFSEFAPMLALYKDGLRLRDLISHRFPFQEAANAFELFASGKSAKVMLEYPVQ